MDVVWYAVVGGIPIYTKCNTVETNAHFVYMLIDVQHPAVSFEYVKSRWLSARKTAAVPPGRRTN